MLTIRWFLFRSVRQATDLTRHVRKLLRAQQDILAPQAIAAVSASLHELQSAIRDKEKKAALAERMAALEKTANQSLKPYPRAAIRENIEVVLVAIAVAMGIRTFFLQPFKIPTGSMQPTLFGITYEDLRDDPGFQIPTGFRRFVDSWFRGISYYHVVAKEEGRLEAVESPKRLFLFIKKQRFAVGNTVHTVWFPPDNLLAKAGVIPNHWYRKGEDLIKLKVVSGDHLFVDRLTYNFRRPKRGEIVVFETRGIRGLAQDLFYIKRLVALGEETVQIANDGHLIINGERLDASAPRFENIYSGTGRPADSQYSGHVNETVARALGRSGLAPLFDDKSDKFMVSPNHYLVLGDNTLNSLDSRSWGDFSRTNVIGKANFVYWPISRRFGLGYR